MGKKMKLKLDDLKVQSFVTSLEGKEDRIRGGTAQGCTDLCGSVAYCTPAAIYTCSCLTGCLECGGGGGGSEDTCGEQCVTE